MNVTNDILSREQRLRKEAELQSLYASLASFREREVSYIEASAVMPKELINHINETRRDIKRVEDELFALTDQTSEARSRSIYRQAFEAEVAGDLSKAIKRYKSAGRHGHPDASAAVRSVRYLMKTARKKSTTDTWLPVPGSRPRNRLLIGLALLLLLILVVAFIINGRSPTDSQRAAAIVPAVTATPSPEVQVIIAAAATPPPTDTPTSTPIPANIPRPTPTDIVPTDTPTSTPTAGPTLRPAPRILEPKDGLVWGDGAIVFEFAKLDLAYDELYCLNTMRGYDANNTENWSHEPRGNKLPYIPVEPNVFRVAKAQGMRCIVWSAYIGKETCDNVISESTEERVIGLPRPCDFK